MSHTDRFQVDIVMGTYNGAKYLGEQFESLRSQTVDQWRLLVRDDGSSDETVDLLAAISHQDPRVCVIRDDLGNLGFNRNFLHLLSVSSAPYVMFCDQDDIWLPKKVELTLAAMLAAEREGPMEPTLVHCDAIVTDSNLAVLQRRFIGRRGRRTGMSSILFANCVQGAAAMLNAPLRAQVLRVKPRLPYDWHCALIAHAIGRRLFLDEPLLLYRQHDLNAIGVGKAGRSSLPQGVSPTLKLAIDAASPVLKTLEFFAETAAPTVADEIRDFADLLSDKFWLARFMIAVRRRYSFLRRRDRLNLLLYILKIPNI